VTSQETGSDYISYAANLREKILYSCPLREVELQVRLRDTLYRVSCCRFHNDAMACLVPRGKRGAKSWCKVNRYCGEVDDERRERANVRGWHEIPRKSVRRIGDERERKSAGDSGEKRRVVRGSKPGTIEEGNE